MAFNVKKFPTFDLESKELKWFRQYRLLSKNLYNKINLYTYLFFRFTTNIDVHLKASALKHMPRNLQTLNLYETSKFDGYSLL